MNRRDFLKTLAATTAILWAQPKLLLSRLSALHGRDFYVSPGGHDDNDGRSYKTAKRTLRAIETVVGLGDTVWVAGT